jgi:hypothetical protein
VRVGCSLAYEVTGTASLLLNVKPRPDRATSSSRRRSRSGQPAVRGVHGQPRQPLPPGDPGAGQQLLQARRHRRGALEARQPRPAGRPPLPPARCRRRSCATRCPAATATRTSSSTSPGRSSAGGARLAPGPGDQPWIHDNIEYRYLSGRGDLSAWDILQRGYGVCRDFAHLAVALNRTFNVPTRYVTGHLPDIGFPDPEGHMDFHAYARSTSAAMVHDGRALPRAADRPDHRVLRAGRGRRGVLDDLRRGDLTYFQVWAYQVPRGTGRRRRSARPLRAPRQPVGRPDGPQRRPVEGPDVPMIASAFARASPDLRQPMNIVYGVSGEGLGHVFEAIEIIDAPEARRATGSRCSPTATGRSSSGLQSHADRGGPPLLQRQGACRCFDTVAGTCAASRSSLELAGG